MPVLYVPDGQGLQFTPSQPVGGSSWVPTGKFRQVVFHPPTPVKPALHSQPVWPSRVYLTVLELAGQAYAIPQNAQKGVKKASPMH